MSNVQDGEPTTIVESYLLLRRRLNYLWEEVRHNSKQFEPATLSLLAESKRFLDLWESEHIDVPRRRFLDRAVLSDAKLLRIRTRIKEAYKLVQHCEVTLRVAYPEPQPGDEVITEDNRRHDCISALEHSLRELRHPQIIYRPVMHGDAPSPSPADPSTPPAPSPHIATVSTPTPSFSRVSPAYSEPSPMYEEPRTIVKQEQDVDMVMTSDPTDRAHLRHDSHLGSQDGIAEAHADVKLPSISTFPSISSWPMPATLAQVPVTHMYGPILPKAAPLHSSPSMEPAPSPPARYHSGSINGNDQQTVMMSPSAILPPLRPSSFYTPTTADRHDLHMKSMLSNRPQSRSNGASSEY